MPIAVSINEVWICAPIFLKTNWGKKVSETLLPKCGPWISERSGI